MLLTLITGVGSLLRAALGPKPRYPQPAWSYYNDEAVALSDFLDHFVKESHGRISINSVTRPIYIQSTYIPGMLVWDCRYVQWNFVVQTSGK